MAQRLLNKVAVVSGAASRPRRRIVQRFQAEGAKVVAFDRDRAGLADLAESTARTLTVEGDVNRPADLDALVQTTRRFGSVDVLVPAAGMFRELPLEAHAGAGRRNLRGEFPSGTADGPRVSGADQRVVGGLPDRVSREARYRPGMGAFSASKTAVASLARTLAVELSPHGIRITASRGPDAFTAASHGVPLVRDVAEAVLFLASEAAGNIVGQEIVVGGPSAR